MPRRGERRCKTRARAVPRRRARGGLRVARCRTVLGAGLWAVHTGVAADACAGRWASCRVGPWAAARTPTLVPLLDLCSHDARVGGALHVLRHRRALRVQGGAAQRAEAGGPATRRRQRGPAVTGFARAGGATATTGVCGAGGAGPRGRSRPATEMRADYAPG